MLDMRKLNPQALARYSQLQQSAGSGKGERNAVDWTQYDYQSYAAAGTTGLTFFNTSGSQKTFDATLATRVSNQVQAGIMDCPLFITAIAVDFITAVSAPATDVLDIIKFYNSGRLAISINDKEIFELAPLGKAGSSYAIAGFVGGTNGTPISNAYTSNTPFILNTPLLIDEGLRFKVTMDWAVATTVTTAARCGVNLIGLKFNPA
jgi:hypothetical protein